MLPRPSLPSPPILLASGLFGLLLSCVFNTHGTSEGPPDGVTTTSATTTTVTTTTITTTTTTTSSTGAGGMGGSGTSSTSATGGTGGALIVCGDGDVHTLEACDDGNTDPNDGCSPGCTVEAGFICNGAPSMCTLIPPQVVIKNTNLVITDPNLGYDGSLGTMQCETVHVADQGFHSIQKVVLTVGIDHSWLGDLVMKLVSPKGTISTMMSRPGLAEPNDTYDENNGDSSQLTWTSPIIFRDDATDDAETMGSMIDPGVVCQDDGRCVYHPNPDSGPGNGLADFQGENPSGDWQVCLADGDDIDVGTLRLVTLSVLAWPSAP